MSISNRSDALNAAIKLSLKEKKITIDMVMEETIDGPSRRTVRSALKDAEEFGWLRKHSPDSNSWVQGDFARKHSKKNSTLNGYPNGQERPIMYYVKTPSDRQHCLNGENIMLSAGVCWNQAGADFSLPYDFDANHLLIDSGGYQAATSFGEEYPYSAKEYHEWAEDVCADVVFGMDWACEDKEVLAKQVSTDVSDILDWEKRYQLSYDYQVEQYREHQRNDYSHEFRPVIQGQTPRDFKDFAEEIRRSDLPTDNIAIGTVCKRSETDKIYDVLMTVRNVFPESNIHLFGATLNIYKDERFKGEFQSSDSAAWMRHSDSKRMFPDSEEEHKEAYLNYKNKVETSVVRN